MLSKFPYSSKFLLSTKLQTKIFPSAGRRVSQKFPSSALHEASREPECICWRSLSVSSKSLSWCSNRKYSNSKNSNDNASDEERRKITPKLIYLHNPWNYLVTKFNLWKLYLFWDREFDEKEFIRGTKKAAIVMTDIIRSQNASRVSQFTTPIGFQQITRDMILSRKDTRLQLVQFEMEHLRRAIPMKVVIRKKFGRKYCFIDMLFVGLRNSKDFNTNEEIVKFNEVIRRMDAEYRIDVVSARHRIVFAEIFMRFRKDYSEHSIDTPDSDWAVSFYKILTFDVLNYDSK